MRQTLPVSVVPSMLWRSSTSVGRIAAGEQRVEVAGADRREVTARERRVRDQRRDRRGVPVRELGSLALDEVERLDRVGRGRAQERRTGDQHADDVVGEATDPEHRRVREEARARGAGRGSG